MKQKFSLFLMLCLLFSWTETMAQKHDQFANFKRYEQSNNELPAPAKKEKRVVFLGNSITEGWVKIHPEFFKENGYIGRGISGQTSYQFLLRFRNDVINLKIQAHSIWTLLSATLHPWLKLPRQTKSR